MGGGGRRRPKARSSSAGSNNKPNRDNRRRGSFNASTSSVRSGLFVEGGLLADWQLSTPSASSSRGRNSSFNASTRSTERSQGSGSRSMLQKSRGNAFAYQYPVPDLQEGALGKDIDGDDGDEDEEIILYKPKESQVVAYVDTKPSSEPHNVNVTYEYSSDFVLGELSHRGLGFCDESEATPSGVEPSLKLLEDQEQSGGDTTSPQDYIDAAGEMNEEMVFERSSPKKKNSAFLSIGGRKLYTEDLSGEESDEDVSESEHNESSGSSESEGSLESSESDSSEEVSESGSDIDEDVMEDYLEGIGGGETLLDAKWLVGNVIDESDDSSSSDLDETVDKLGGIALQDASREYGMKKPYKKKQVFHGADRAAWSLTLDDVMLFKDPRTASGRKSRAARFPQSWPLGAQKSQRSKTFPGEKKKHRKELIAVKRRDRMLRRGVDLEKINKKLEQIVLDGVDMFSFQPMDSRDCSQIQRLAAIYQLRSVRQGSGKKRFVTVVRTDRTCIPSSNDKLRLEKLIGSSKDEADFPVVDPTNMKSGTIRRNNGNATSRRSNSLKNSAHRTSDRETSDGRRRKKLPVASNPVSFVSSGIMQSDSAEFRLLCNPLEEATGSTSNNKATVTFGAFEEHTTGFGSKMMAKMGFIEGRGLGKDGSGMAEPIEVVKRPKSLGLGMDFSEPAEETERKSESQIRKSKSGGKQSSKSQGIGAFEQHTKGFGSKMMAKMGFVEGMGLGRDSQGMVHPLVAVRRPKARGLGARG